MEYQIVLLFAVLSVLAGGLPGVLGCSELAPHERNAGHNETEDQKVFYSDYVVFGRAMGTAKGPSYPFNSVDGVRTIEFQVLCTYKAPNKMKLSKIYVSGVGNKADQLKGCPPAPLKKEQIAIVFLRKLEGGAIDNLFEIEFQPNSFDESEIDTRLDELTIHCDLNEQGMKADKVCFEPVEPEDCLPYTPNIPTTPSAPDMKPDTTMSPKVKTEKPMEPKPDSEPELTTAGKVIGKPIPNNKNDTYNTPSKAGESSAGNSDGSNGGASVQFMSQSLVVLISVLFILV